MGDTALVSMYVPWPHPVRAAQYRTFTDLDGIRRWVASLHAEDRLPPGVWFTIEHRHGEPHGVLITQEPGSDHSRVAGRLYRTGFLVFTGSELLVLSEYQFHQAYHDPDDRVTLPRTDPRVQLAVPLTFFVEAVQDAAGLAFDAVDLLRPQPTDG